MSHRFSSLAFTRVRRLSTLARIAWSARRVHAVPPHAREAARRALAAQLGEARGVPMKIGQLMAGMGEDSAYGALTRSIDPLPLKRIQPVLEQNWQRPVEEMLGGIDESVAAASLGQVHEARLLDGTTVAVKVQYPDIAAAVSAEMTLSGMLPSGGPVKRWGFDLNGYKTTLRENLERELDYLGEAQQQARFAAEVEVDGLHVPHVYLEMCRKGVLVQQWVTGERLSDVKTWPLPQRLKIARTLIQTLFRSLFGAGLVHGDPHPGNLLFARRGQRDALVHLLDYGCVVEVERARRVALLKLILFARGECSVVPLGAFVALGFDAEKLVHIAESLRQMVPMLFQPFREDRPFDVTGWHLGTDISELLGEYRWWFRSAGPADLLLLLRAFQGLVRQLEVLDVRLPWWPLLVQVVDPGMLEEAAAWEPPSLGDAPLAEPGAARSLRIKVVRAGETKIESAMPAREALELQSLVPDHVRAAMLAQGVTLESIQQQVTELGLVPQTLVNVDEDDTHYEVWLE